MTHGERGMKEVVGIKLIFLKKIKFLRANYIVSHDIFNQLSQSLPVVDHSNMGPLKRGIIHS